MKKILFAALCLVSSASFADGVFDDIMNGKKYLTVEGYIWSSAPDKLNSYPEIENSVTGVVKVGSLTESGWGIETSVFSGSGNKTAMSLGVKSNVDYKGASLVATYPKEFLWMNWTPKIGIAATQATLDKTVGSQTVSSSATSMGLTFGVDLHMGNWLLSYDSSTAAGGGGVGLGYKYKF